MAEIGKLCCTAIGEEVNTDNNAIGEEVNTDNFHNIEHCMRCHLHTYIIAEFDVS